MRPDRHHARILVMQALCQLDVQGAEALKLTVPFLRESEADEQTQRYARTLVDFAWERRHAFRDLIQSAGASWDIDRMDLVDRNVIRVALAELTRDEVPPKVVLNEAIEIAREYASAESAGFVNGVLDELYQRMRSEQGDDPPKPQTRRGRQGVRRNGEWRMENGE